MNYEEIRDTIDVSLRDKLSERMVWMYEAQYTRFNDITIVSIGADEVRLRMPLAGKMNSLGFAHGGAIYTIADNAFGFAANMGDIPQIALSGSIIYHRPGQGKELIAVTSKVSDTNSVSTYDVKVYCNDKHIATATFVGFKLKDKKFQ
ncbi:MAG: PaaI family thioesterase [Methanomassiliicoccaceae archaeon]|jgi:acyl-CoA thioesterase|nr:PaaI family thioesterase [Methanomassiliicoccaceae archaeon]